MVEVQRRPTDTLIAPIGLPYKFQEPDVYQSGYAGKFDPAVHLDYEPPSKAYTFSELGLDPNDRNSNKSNAVALGDIAFTEPFRLLSAAGVEAVRSELFSQAVLDNCTKQVVNQQGDALKYLSIRNPGRQSSFLLDLWRSEGTQAVIDNALGGYEVVPTMDHECSHANLQIPQIRLPKDAMDGWHQDGNAQWVVVLMLSDPRGLIGGETQIRRGDGSIHNVTFPAPGYAIMLQGMIVEHNVRPVMSANGEMSGERLTMVTSYQPRSYKEPQQSVIGYLRKFSDEDQLLSEWAEWRFEVMSKRLADASEKLRNMRKAGKFEVEFARCQARDMREYLAITEREMAADYDVVKMFT